MLPGVRIPKLLPVPELHVPLLDDPKRDKRGKDAVLGFAAGSRQVSGTGHGLLAATEQQSGDEEPHEGPGDPFAPGHASSLTT